MADLEIDDQVREIVGLMLRGEWAAGASHIELSEKWGVTCARIRDRAADASRFIRLCAGDDEAIKEGLLRNVARIGAKAELAGSFRDAVSAQELHLRALGHLEQKQREERIDVPTAELAELLRAQGYDVKGPDAGQPGIEESDGAAAGHGESRGGGAGAADEDEASED